MPSRATSCTTAPTCAWCRRCSAMPTSPPRKSIPMCWRTVSRAWCATCTRWARTDAAIRHDQAHGVVDAPLVFSLAPARDAARRRRRSPPARAGARPQTRQERQWCESEEEVTVSQRIDGCSAVIKAGRDRSEKLAEPYSSRGLAYRLKGEYDRAIQDYGQAIKLNAKSATAYANRGVAYDKN